MTCHDGDTQCRHNVKLFRSLVDFYLLSLQCPFYDIYTCLYMIHMLGNTGNRQRTVAIFSPPCTLSETGTLLVVHLRLAGLWAPGHSPVFASRGVLGLQILLLQLPTAIWALGI